MGKKAKSLSNFNPAPGSYGHLPAERRQAIREDRARRRKLAEELARKEKLAGNGD